MKRQVRSNVFETNSSSTHAICISKNNNYKKRDYIEFEFGEFGWEFDIRDSVYARASYLITAIYNNSKEYADEKIQQLEDLLRRNHIEYELPHPGIKTYEYDGNTRSYYDIDGYIDHSEETSDFVEAVLTDDDTFMRYMFGDSFIVTGNDNNDEYDDYMYEVLETVVTKYGSYHNHGALKKKFDAYDIFEKGN